MIQTVKVKSLRTFWSRFWGLKRRPGTSQILHFPRCQAVHTFGVTEKLDLFWLDQFCRVIRVDLAVRKNRIHFCHQAKGVIESTKKLNLKRGDLLRLRGQALVETAVVLPMLFLLLFGFIEISLLLQAQQKLTHAAQWGTQVLALTNNDDKLAGALADFYDSGQVAVQIESKSYEDQTLISGNERRHKDLVKVELVENYALHIPFLNVEAFDITASASARILCQNLTPPYQCD